MANEYLVKGESLTAVADKIRILNGTTETMSLDAMATNLGAANDEVDSQTELLAQAVAALEGKAGGGSEPSLQSKSVTPSAVQQTVVPDSDYDGLDKVTVAAIPSTYVKPTATKAATTYTPTTSNQTIAAGTYCSGAQTIKGDANLVAGNIKSGVSIFGVAGSYEGSGSGGGDAVETCTVTFDNISQDCPIVVVSAIVVENGIYQTYINFSNMVNQLYTITIPNVVCGSEIGLGSCFHAGYGVAPYIEISGTASFNSWNRLADVNTTFMTMTFTAPSVPNENCTISFMGNV